MKHAKTMRRWLFGAAIASAATVSLPAFAGQVTDPLGDFLPTYTGPQNADLDILNFSSDFDGTVFHLSVTTAGPISTPGGLYVFGFNRGAGFVGFPGPAPGVRFDSVAAFVISAGIGGTLDLTGGVAGPFTPLPPTALNVSGSSFTLAVPISRLPSTGFTPNQYTVNLWTRVGTGNDAQLADFAPDNSNISAVPEPMSLGLIAGGLLAAGALRRRQRR